MRIGYDIHIFVCENERPAEHPRGCCAAKGSKEIRMWFKDLLREHGLKAKSRANRAGCLNYCELGPTVVVYPDGTWYGPRTHEDVQEIVLSHVRDGKVVERLLLEGARKSDA